LSGRSGQPVIVGIRPEHFFEAGSVGGECEMTIEVMAREALGSEVIVYFDLGARQVVAGDPDVSRELTDRRARRFAARLQGRADVREGDKMTLRFDPAAVRFFDPATHRAIA
jgi:multiple sugar transport system ATP-binding protein